MRNYLRNIRVESKQTQKDVAIKLCISESYYNLIENGERQAILRADMLMKLSSIFGLSLDELVKLESKESQGSGDVA